jgi:signal peptidase I
LNTFEMMPARPIVQRARSRRPWVAALLSFLAPGVGQLYNGDARRGWFFFFLFCAVEMARFLPRVGSKAAFAGVALAGLSDLILRIGTAIQAFRWARRSIATQMTWFQRGWIYVLLILMMPIANGLAPRENYEIQSFYIPAGSMTPTTLTGDYLIAQKTQRPGDPLERGDVVVFILPTNTSVDYIKRVIGLPGDTIQMKQGELYINDKEVPRKRIEDYLYQEGDGAVLPMKQYIETLPNGRQHRIIKIGDSGPLDNTQEYRVPPGDDFMMGDNRDNSQDSRVLSAVGYVPAENLIGKAQFIYFSTDGTARLREFWKWPFAIRYNRLFKGIN